MTAGAFGKCIIRKHLIRIILILTVFTAFIGIGLGMQSPENYDFCRKLDNIDENTDNYTELIGQLRKMCGMNLNQNEQELGILSVEFLEELSVFSATWKENETVAREYARRIARSYRQIKGMNMSSSEIQAQIDYLYVSEISTLGFELQIQDNYKKDITYLIGQLAEKERDLTASFERLNIEAEYKKRIEENVSHIYNQRTIESRDQASRLRWVTTEYERGKTSFKATVLPYLVLGIVLGGIIGFALSVKWKKEKRYWHAYSSSANVVSPLKFAAVLTGALLATLLLYLFLSGIWEAIAAG